MGEDGRDNLKDHGVSYVFNDYWSITKWYRLNSKTENLSADSFTRIDLKHVFLYGTYIFLISDKQKLMQ